MDDRKAIKEMSAAMAATDDKDLIEDFLMSLLTKNEIHEVATRWALVKLIKAGVSQRKVAETLGLSLCKITRGSKELKKENSSFRLMIDLESQLDA
ncbi:transcriptional regulator [Oceanispirochaeta crateris]|jgi:TrpR family trp operon transcriptional repressor|uniref:Transcriptional regulator n=1 Tax=Oceanispirochaeta crateris TaxID=2518645 RepID=A0A5C1QH86_9SPIO|nr:Trp family transcriptional regulator [Oceanispirochaeta crateris]QEN07485.1 transcriptional regulator [Oceanispirochaeta crateris]